MFRSATEPRSERVRPATTHHGRLTPTTDHRPLTTHHSLLLQPELTDLLMQGIAINSEAVGGFDLDIIGKLQHLFNQLALDTDDQTIVQFAVLTGERLDAGAHEALDHALQVDGARAGGAQTPAAQRGERQHLWLYPMACPHGNRPLAALFELTDVAP